MIIQNSASKSWSPNRWQRDQYVKKCVPKYPNVSLLKKTKQKLVDVPPLVFANESIQLKQLIADAQQGNAFVLQGGECAESLHIESKHDTMRLAELLSVMSLTLSYYMETPVVSIGRIAGQYAKPRSSDTETQGKLSLYSFMGSIVNSPEFTVDARTPDPLLMFDAYRHSSSIQSMIRSMIHSEYLHASRLPITNGHVRKAAVWKYQHKSVFPNNQLYISHEALLLDYEEPLTRKDSITDQWYNTSAHFLWLGERTRFLNSAHIEYLSGIQNPLGIKVGPTTDPEQLITIIQQLNPYKEPGKITLIFRMGRKHVHKATDIIQYIHSEHPEHPVLYMLDPMHGNNDSTNAIKVRYMENIIQETEHFQNICEQCNVHFGGIHLEMTANNTVLECMNRSDTPDVSRYMSLCDPRLNRDQCMQLVTHITAKFG